MEKETMLVRHLDREALVRAYGVDLQVLYPWEGVVEPPFGAAWAILSPGSSTKVHQHQEGETFFIARGQGVMEIGGRQEPVSAGSVVFQRPFQAHTLTNTSEDEDLLFLTVWWEDKALWPEIAAEAGGESAVPADGEDPAARAKVRRVMVTAAPPTPNGDLHLGHFAGPYLSADVHTRYLRLRGQESRYACGTDDHCMFVERMGETLGKSGQEAAAHFTAAIRESLDLAGIHMDFFLLPDRSQTFTDLALGFLRRLVDRGAVEPRQTESPWCDSCDRYLHEADIAGLCPHCGVGVTGNTCEACGRVNDSHNLVDSRCTGCGETPGTRRVTRLMFPLGQYAERLTRYHRQTAMSPHLRAFCEAAIADGLPDVAVSHFSDWGIPVPSDDPELSQQTLYVWFEMAARYLAYAQHLAEADGLGSGAAPEAADGGDAYRLYWASENGGIVQFFGFDNSFYYTLFLPALYMAFDPGLSLPEAFVSNEFYRLDGEKFSTTRRHAILGRELFGQAHGDSVRFYLAWSCPEREETNFTLEDFVDTVRRELVDGWQTWLHALGEKITREAEGKVPSTGDWTAEHQHFFHRLEVFREEATEALAAATFSPQRLTRVLCELVRTARRFGRGEDHWRSVPERSQERRTGLALELLAAQLLAVLAAPVMPDFAERLWRDLGFGGGPGLGSWDRATDWVPAGQSVDLGPSYFSIPDQALATMQPSPVPTPPVVASSHD